MDRWSETPEEQRVLLIHLDPGSTGEPHWDALVGGMVERLCWHAGQRAPGWVGHAGRFLDHRWWPVDLPLLRVWTLADTPAALVRRGVMLSRTDLERV